MINLKQNDDGSLGLESPSVGGPGGFLTTSINYNVPAADTSFFVADRPYIVKAIRGCPDVAGTGGACTAVVRKVPSGTALASGSLLHAGSFNLAGTVNTQQALVLVTTPDTLLLAPGDRLGVGWTGTATSAIGSITVTLSPA